MSTEVRFVLAIVLMIGVLVVTNLLFPPVAPEGPEGGVPGDTTPGQVAPGEAGGSPDTGARPPGAAGEEAGEATGVEGAPSEVELPEQEERRATEEEAAPQVEEELVTVEGPLYRHTFSNLGARLVSAELLRFESFTRDGPVQLVPEESEGSLGHRLVVGSDTLDLRGLPFEISPAGGLTLGEDDEPGTLTFVYRDPEGPLRIALEYTFGPNSYIAGVRGRVEGVDRGVVFTTLGPGLEFNEADRDEDARNLAYVGNHLEEGIRSETMEDMEERRLQDGPFLWAALKNKYFVVAILPGLEGESGSYLGGLIADPLPADHQARIVVTQSLRSDGTFGYRLFAGPQDFARLSDIGEDLEDVNPYGWKFFRPIVRPFVAVIMTILVFLHENLNLAYGWVLILFGIMMRVLLFPLYQKSMKAQIQNMAVQPLLKEIQEKHKDNPEKLQKEMMKLYKEHGFNPLAGCLPMLLPWPILISLFFVFQNTIELRGVPFLWLPDLAAADPYYILPLVLMASMFLLQWVSYRSMDEPNPQMKMMMFVMPLVLGFVFAQFASGLNLYYATANLATLPQQYWVAQERKKARARGPVGGKAGDKD